MMKKMSLENTEQMIASAIMFQQCEKKGWLYEVEIVQRTGSCN